MRKRLCYQHPEKADDDRSDQMRHQQTPDAGFLDWNSPAGVPGRETDKCVKEAEWKKERGRLKTANFGMICNHVEEQFTQHQPGEKVKSKPPRMSKDRMHGLPALHLNTAKYCCASYDHRFYRAIGTRDMSSLIDVATKNPKALY